MQPQNIMLIIADQHRQDCLGFNKRLTLLMLPGRSFLLWYLIKRSVLMASLLSGGIGMLWTLTLAG